MAATIELKFGPNAQALTITLASLANNGQRASTAIDNTTNLFRSIKLRLDLKSGASGVSATGFVNVYAVGSVDGGTTYDEGATGSDAGITLTVPPNARLIGCINMVANATTYHSRMMEVADAFSGTLPDHIVIIVENKSGAAFDATEGNHTKKWQGVQDQSV
jgi:hypothetical protein